MTKDNLGPIISGNEISSELKRRKKKQIFQRVTAKDKKLIAEKVETEKKDGWTVVKKSSKSTRMAKPKQSDEQFEDEVWSVLAQMGFEEMSKGRHFTIAVEEGLEPRQIDVFAKDAETVVLVECTQRESPARKNMDRLIEKIRSIRKPAFDSIRKHYGGQSKLKIKCVIATRNIDWSKADRQKCEQAQIAIIADGELDYYASLVKHLKEAARYQFLAHMFSGQKIDGLSRQVVATRGKMGGDVFYTFLIPPNELLKIAYVGHKSSRDVENLKTYQRMLQPRRLKKIAEYINNGGTFPTNIIVNLKTNRKAGLKFNKDKMDTEPSGEQTLGVLSLPPNYASAWIIDGQHRLYGYAYAQRLNGFKDDKTLLPVLAYENLPSQKEMDLFIDINSKQVKVSTGLLIELYADLHWNSDSPEEGFEALLSRIASRLNNKQTSPIHNRMVVTGKKKTPYRCLTQTSIRDGLKTARLLGTLTSGTIVPGPLSTATGHTPPYDDDLEKGLAVLSDCLSMFSERLPEHWKLGDAPGGYLCTNNGIRAVFLVIQDISDYLRQKAGTNLYLLNADETFTEIKPYLQALVDFFTRASTQEIRKFRRLGSSQAAVRRQAYELEACISEELSEFKPTGLVEYLKTRDDERSREAIAKVQTIERRLSNYVIGALKGHHGSEGETWWVEGVPVGIRMDCAKRHEEANREGEPESRLFLINYKDICLKNWHLMKEVISFDNKDKDNKQQNAKWIGDLNEIRNITAHPGRGPLTPEQVAFVENILDKVERYMPDDY